jgi:hypothetical protein
MLFKAYIIILLIISAENSFERKLQKRLTDFMGIEEQNFIYFIIACRRRLSLLKELEKKHLQMKESKELFSPKSLNEILTMENYMIG